MADKIKVTIVRMVGWRRTVGLLDNKRQQDLVIWGGEVKSDIRRIRNGYF